MITSVSSLRSSAESFGTSPASPNATIPWEPHSSAKRTTRRWASTSTAPSSVNGVQIAGYTPRHFSTVAVAISPLETESDARYHIIRDYK